MSHLDHGHVVFVPVFFLNGVLNRGCLVFMFSLHFSGSKLLINLRRQFRVRKICVREILFTQCFCTDLQYFHFVFRITILNVRMF